MGAVHVEEVVVAVLSPQVFGEVGPQVLEQLPRRLLDLRPAVVVSIGKMLAVVSDGEGFIIREDELILGEDAFNPAGVLLRISVVNRLS